MSNWYRDALKLLESAPISTHEQGAQACRDGVKWYQNPHESGSKDAYEWDQGHTSVRTGDKEQPVEESNVEGDDAPPADTAAPEPCIPRIARYDETDHQPGTPNGRKQFSFEALLFFPAADANFGKIVCYAHVGQHAEASQEFFNMNTFPITEKNLKRAGLTQQDFADLIKEWENVGPDRQPVKLYKRDQSSFREQRWHGR